MSFKTRKLILYILASIGVVAIDQWTKYLAMLHLSDAAVTGESGFFNFFSNPPAPSGQGVPVIGNLLQWHLVYNKGMAWGLFAGNQVVLITVALVALTVFSFLYFRTGEIKGSWFIRLSLLMCVAGGLGNLIDRLFRGDLFKGVVVDMIYVKCIDFPVFNVADMCISVGCVLFMISLWVIRGEHFGFEDDGKIGDKSIRKEEEEKIENN